VITLVAVVVSAACVLACARRLRLVLEPTALDPAMLQDALRGDEGKSAWPKLRRVFAAHEELAWERDLFDAFAHERGPERDALVNEQLSELDFRIQRWARVPRVCARVATSAGFLFGTLSFLRTMSSSDSVQAVLVPALVQAVNAVAFGIAATVFAIAVHVRARHAARTRLEATDRLVERLEALAN
jgi:hypothetical protein